MHYAIKTFLITFAVTTALFICTIYLSIQHATITCDNESCPNDAQIKNERFTSMFNQPRLVGLLLIPGAIMGIFLVGGVALGKAMAKAAIEKTDEIATGAPRKKKHTKK